ncbi:MAG: hypothetical protein P4L53_01455 [Candidatus Obscuribacterales bacterium]|nr:hypothetical protein [Candidatus Obscuribacterales bacterium]
MNCKSCKLDLQADWRFCPICGVAASQEASKKSKAAPYGPGIRAQVFEVIVRQAIAGAPWRQICVGPMQVNSITPEEIEEEVRRRQGGSEEPPTAPVPKKPHPSAGAGSIGLPLPAPSRRLLDVRALVLNLTKEIGADHTDLQEKFSKILSELDAFADTFRDQEEAIHRASSEAQLQQDLERENYRTRQEIKPADGNPPHHI